MTEEKKQKDQIFSSTEEIYNDSPEINHTDIRFQSSHPNVPGKYAVTSIADQSRVNGGDVVTIHLMITGSGKIEGGKFHMCISARDILVEDEAALREIEEKESSKDDVLTSKDIPKRYFDSKRIGGWVTTRTIDISELTVVSDNGEQWVTPKSDSFPMQYSETAMVSSSAALSLPEDVFTPIPENMNADELWRDVRPIMTEMYTSNDSVTPMRGHPPIKLELNVKEEVDPGDYSMFFTFTYFNGERFLHDQQEITIHVDSWVERNRKRLQIFAIAIPLGILAVGIIGLFV